MGSVNSDRRPIESLVPPLKPESLRFLAYKRAELGLPVPVSRTAAVAVILFVGRLGDLYVLLSTRAGGMRTYARDTALPGGKHEDGDGDAEGTARREAYEEIGLPMDRDKVRLLCLLDPFLTGHSLIVTPAVLLVTDNSLNPLLNPAEVAHLFAMPLPAFLHARPSRIPGWHYGLGARVAAAVDAGRLRPTDVPAPPEVGYADGPGEVGGGGGGGGSAGAGGKAGGSGGGGRVETRYWQYRDVAWGRGTVRMHRFLTGREGEGVKPVYGLTAVGYARQPSFDVRAPGQRAMRRRILDEVVEGQSALALAVRDEGGLPLWAAAAEQDEADGAGVAADALAGAGGAGVPADGLGRLGENGRSRRRGEVEDTGEGRVDDADVDGGPRPGLAGNRPRSRAKL